MASIAIGVIGTFAATVAIASSKNYVVNKLSSYISYKKLNIELKTSIRDLNYINFKSIMYKIKNNDIKYQSNYYFKITLKYGIPDSIYKSKEVFIIKFDSNYDFDDLLSISPERSYTRRYTKLFNEK